MTPKDLEEKLRAAIEHLDFAMKMCEIQAKVGRMFVFEHPVQARSWRIMKRNQSAHRQNTMAAVNKAMKATAAPAAPAMKRAVNAKTGLTKSGVYSTITEMAQIKPKQTGKYGTFSCQPWH